MALFDKIALGLIVALTAALALLGVLYRGQSARLDAAEASLRAVQAARVADDAAFKNQSARLKKLEGEHKERANARERVLEAHPDWAGAPVPDAVARGVR